MEFTFDTTVNVRAGPSTQTQKVAQYHPGEIVKIDRTVFSGDNIWGSYMGSSGIRRYVCLNENGESYAH